MEEQPRRASGRVHLLHRLRVAGRRQLLGHLELLLVVLLGLDALPLHLLLAQLARLLHLHLAPLERRKLVLNRSDLRLAHARPVLALLALLRERELDAVLLAHDSQLRRRLGQRHADLRRDPHGLALLRRELQQSGVHGPAVDHAVDEGLRRALEGHGALDDRALVEPVRSRGEHRRRDARRAAQVLLDRLRLPRRALDALHEEPEVGVVHGRLDFACHAQLPLDAQREGVGAHLLGGDEVGPRLAVPEVELHRLEEEHRLPVVGVVQRGVAARLLRLSSELRQH